MSKALWEQVEVAVFDLDGAAVQEQLVRVNGKVLTITQLKEKLGDGKKNRQRQVSSLKGHLYEAIRRGDDTKAELAVAALKEHMSEEEILRAVEAQGLAVTKVAR